MLVLDRKVHEGFWIEGGIFVKVLSVGRKRVKLGIEAPPNIKIVREELARMVREELAAGPSEADGTAQRAHGGGHAEEGSLRSLRRRR